MPDETLSVGDLAVRLERGSVVVIDVRPAEQVVEGSIPGSWPVGITELPVRLRDADDPLHRRLRRDAAVVALVAGDGERWTSARSMFDEVGVGVVRVDGEVRAWSRAGRPMNRG